MRYQELLQRITPSVVISLLCGVPSYLTAQSPQKILAPLPGAYVGAAVNPDGYTAADDPNFDADLETETEASEATLPGNLQIHTRYIGWTNASTSGGTTTYTATFPDTGMNDDVAHGRITLVSWTCSSDASFKPTFTGTRTARTIAAAPPHPIRSHGSW